MFGDKNPNIPVVLVSQTVCPSCSHLRRELETAQAVRGAVQSLLCSSDPTVTGSVLEFTCEDEEGGDGGDRNVENQLPNVPQAEQVEVA